MLDVGSRRNMVIEYIFTMDEAKLRHQVNLDREFDSSLVRDDVPEWTHLTYNQCSNCPLTVKDCQHCPVAIDLEAVVSDFRDYSAETHVNLQVLTPDREYFKETRLEEGLRSLMGLIMATSACPILSVLKSNARNHLPFVSQEEFILRTSAFYLLRQYFLYRQGRRPDWDLQGMIHFNQELQLLNQAFWQRIYSACDSDSNLKVLYSLFNYSSSISYSLDAELQKIKEMMLKDGSLAVPGNEPSTNLF